MRRWIPSVLAASVLAAPALGPAARAEEPAPKATLEDALRTIEALKARVRDQERRLAELENRAAPDYAKELRQMVADILKEGDPMDLKLYWKDGLRMDSRDGNVKIKFGGRFYYDFTWDSGGDLEKTAAIGDLADGAEVRTGRLYVEGELWKNLAFKWEWDFATASPVIKDAYLEFRRLPCVQNLRIGHFKEPFSLEELTSSRYITFMERSLPNVFVPSRNAGAMLHGALFDDLLTFAGGWFRDVNDQGFGWGQGGAASTDGDNVFTGRLTASPVYLEKGRYVVHLGAAYSYRELDGLLRYRQRPEAHLLQRFVDTGNVAVNEIHVVGGELAAVVGPFHAEAEYVGAYPTRAASADLNFCGWYAQVGYFLTGETRPYKRASGTFDRAKPKKPYGKDGGFGAVEVAGRYSELDLRQGATNGGTLRDYTAGLNWYVNNNVRLMFNYIHSDLDRSAAVRGDADIFTMRLQFDF